MKGNYHPMVTVQHLILLSQVQGLNQSLGLLKISFLLSPVQDLN